MEVPSVAQGTDDVPAMGPVAPATPVAVVGVSCRLPGGLDCLDKLWKLLEVGGEAWSSVPQDRFNEAAFHHPNADNPNGTNNHRGGHFIDGDIRDFDHSFFRLSPQQAMAMDPQQRILLEMSYEALENAGWSREAVAGSDTSVHVAMFTNDFDRNLYKDPLDLPVYYITGSEKAILANRISHIFDLRGSSVTLDTACSGSLVALHQACQGLHNCEASASIVAAANITLNPDHYIGMSNLHMLGASGRSFPFDERGVGYGRGEGFAVLVLKRLDDALRDRDPIHAVIRGTAVNHNGYTPPGIAYPSGTAQADLIRSAYTRGGRRPQDVSYIEAHGTGTVAGDSQELDAISKVFVDRREGSRPLYVGSIKGNIGHTENTSGLASLLKATLILNRGQIPPTAGFLHPKPGLPLSHIRIPTEVVPLPRIRGTAPFVSINSFGFGGANAHAILEQRPQSRQSREVSQPCPRLFVFSANSRTSLEGMMMSYREWMDKRPDVALADVSYTLCHRRSSLPWGFSCVASDRPSLMEELHRGIQRCPSKPRPTSRPYIALVFTGQGAQWAGMGRELLVKEPSPSSLFRSSVHKSRDIIMSLGAGWDLEEELLRDGKETKLKVAELAQPATTAIQIALVDVLRAQGIRPQAVVGHSSGEIAAAYTAGYMSHRAAIEVSFARGRVASLAKTRCPVPGAMMSVGLGEHDIAPYMKDLTTGALSIACVNSPRNVTVSGDAEAMDELAGRLAACGDGVFHRRLIVDTAYHSHHMQAVADEYCRILGDQQQLSEEDQVHGQEEGITFVSSVTGSLKAFDFSPEYWTTNLVSTVRFCDAVQFLVRKLASDTTSSDGLVFIEVGPHPALAGPVRQSIAGLDNNTTPEFTYNPTLQRNKGAVSSMLELASHLLESGVRLNFDHVSALTSGFHEANVLSDLPSYAWDHSIKHWHESRISREYRMRRDPYHDLLGVRTADSTSLEPRWRHMVSLTTLPWLAHHVIDGLAVFPGSGYLCMAIEATRQLSRERYPSRQLETIALRHVSFLRALVVAEPPQRVEMQLSFTPRPGKALAFSFSVAALSDGDWHQHCTGIVEGIFQANKEAEAETSAPASTKPEWQSPLPDETVLTTEMVYQGLGESGNAYGPSFIGIRCMSMTAASSPSATATIGIPDTASTMPSHHQEPHLIHPSTLDIILHTVVPVVSRQLGPGSVMPVYIDELLLAATAAMPRSPGSELVVLATLASSQFRTAHADLVARSECLTVVTASGIEMRSLGSRTAAGGHTALPGDIQQICYELVWQPDLEFLTHESLPDLTLEGFFSHLSFKIASISVLDLCGAGDAEISAGLINAIKASECRLACYDCISSAPENYKRVQEVFRGYSTQTRLVNLEDDHSETETPESHAYDLVLASTSRGMVLNHASSLMKPSGVLLLTAAGSLSMERETLDSAATSGVPAPFEAQFICRDDGRGLSTIVARSHNDGQEQRPPKVHVISHNARIGSLKDRLLASFPEISVDIWGADAVNRLIQDNDDNDQACFLVVDDQVDPILLNPEHFAATTELLSKPARIIWLSPDTQFHMQQITGVARTAHAENDRLHLVTIHAAPERLGDEVLHRLLMQCFSNLHRGLFSEREYRLKSDGTILVPRLCRSDQLNYAVGLNRPEGLNIQRCRFTDSNQALVLTFSNNKNVTEAMFTQAEDTMLKGPLDDDDAVEVETEAFVLSRGGLRSGLCEHVGIITRAGRGVLDPKLAPGSRVVSLASVTGASRLCISQSLASTIPPGTHISPANAAAMMVNLMSACHALHGLARLQPTSTVLIHGASSPLGCAAVAVARAIGARVKVTATDQQKAQDLITQLNISADDLLLHSCSLRQRLTTSDSCIGRLDAIVIATVEEFNWPSQVLSRLKPFGHVVSMARPTQGDVELQSKLLPNASFHNCDTEGLLERCSESLRAGLVAQAVLALKYLPIGSGSSEPCSRDVGQVREALHMIDSGIQNQVVVTVKKESMVISLVRQDAQIDNRWASKDVSYVVSGGLGDLGRRLLYLMARRGAKHLVTLSRRTVDSKDYDQLQAKLEGIQPGCRLYCLTCDLTSESSVQKAATALRSKGVPPVRGVINSAAILQDRPLASMTSEDFSLISKVKVEGTRALDNAFASPHLEFFIMLSSAANIVGTSGQANYNAGNAAQDALACSRKETSCHYMSLSIGWIEDALITMDNDARLGGLRRAGLKAIRRDELARFFDYALGAAAATQGRITQAVIGFDAASLLAATTHNGNVRSAMFSHVHTIRDSTTAPGEQESSERGGSAATSFEQALASDDRDRVVDYINAVIRRLFIKLTSADASIVSDSHGSMLAFGLDSLVAIELRNWLMREFDAPLQSSEILNDQTIRALAAKVASRSRIVASRLKDTQVNGEQAGSSLSTIPSEEDSIAILPSLPLPTLQDTLRMFCESRRAVDSEETQALAANSVTAFLESMGPALQKRLEESTSAEIAESYERDIYLGRREPLQDYSQFSLVHPVDAPAQSQITRAAVLTVAATDFARRLLVGDIPPTSLHGMPTNQEAHDWLFWATRHPGVGVDSMERYPSTPNIIVLRRGHVFQLTLPGFDVPLQMSAVHEAYRKVVALSEMPETPVCTLTSDDRRSWYLARKELEVNHENTVTLSAIDSAMFVVCLDDETPSYERERYIQFLTNGREQPFSNRWLDKPVQFIVTANGLSAGLYEHTKIDALDVRSLHRHVIDALFAHGSDGFSTTPPTVTYAIRKHVWKKDSSIIERIKAIQHRPRYSLADDYNKVYVENLGLDFLRSRQAPPHATTHLMALLAVYLVDGTIRPAWEIVSLGVFARGRIDWVQTVSPPVRSFLEAAAAAVDDEINDERIRQLRLLFHSASQAYSQNMSMAARGYGAVRHLYALYGALEQNQNSTDYQKSDEPSLFQTQAWKATRRDGPGQDFKIGFMPDQDSPYLNEWDESGFLMQGEHAIYIHCGVHEHALSFIVTAQSDYNATVCKALRSASTIVQSFLV